MCFTTEMGCFTLFLSSPIDNPSSVFLQIKRKIEWSTRTIECKGKGDKLSTCLKSSVFNKNMGYFFFLLNFSNKKVTWLVRETRHFWLLMSYVKPAEFPEAFQDQWFWIIWLVSWDFPHLAGYFWRAWARLRVLSWNQTLISFLVQSQALCTGSDIFYSIAGFLSISYFYLLEIAILEKVPLFYFSDIWKKRSLK